VDNDKFSHNKAYVAYGEVYGRGVVSQREATPLSALVHADDIPWP